MKELWIVAGPNGAGKSTLIQAFAKNVGHKKIHIAPNPDVPNQTFLESIRNQKRMIDFVKDSLIGGKSVLFETTGSPKKTILDIIKGAKANGYFITIWYLWLPSVQLAENRVNIRHQHGGHFVSKEEIIKRYNRSLENLYWFIREVDRAIVVNRSRGSSGRVVASKNNGCVLIKDKTAWGSICKHCVNLKSLEQVGV